MLQSLKRRNQKLEIQKEHDKNTITVEDMNIPLSELVIYNRQKISKVIEELNNFVEIGTNKETYKYRVYIQQNRKDTFSRVLISLPYMFPK